MNRARRRQLERRGIDSVKFELNEAAKMYAKEEVEKAIEAAKQETYEETVNTAMLLLLSIPLTVLKDHYWEKSYRKRLPGFTNYILDYYAKWQDGEIDLDELRDNLWKYAGLRIDKCKR